jgi:cell division protein ZapA
MTAAMTQAPNSKPQATPLDRSITLDVTLLGREFKVACRESERTELMEAVAFLDRRMREIRDAGKVSGTDRIAVMAALNIAHEFLRDRRARAEKAAGAEKAVSDTPIDDAAARRRIESMQAIIDQTMAGQEKLF